MEKELQMEKEIQKELNIQYGNKKNLKTGRYDKELIELLERKI